jgi:capsular polysaccharide transport system permease protein
MILVTFLVLAGVIPPPDDLFKMIVAWVLLGWFAMSMGLVMGCVAAVSETIERVWHVLTYLFMPMSGAFFMVSWLPTHSQAWALLVPSVSCAELLREGYFGAHVHAHYDLFYVAIFNTVLMLVGLAMVKRVAMTVEGG